MPFPLCRNPQVEGHEIAGDRSEKGAGSSCVFGQNGYRNSRVFKRGESDEPPMVAELAREIFGLRLTSRYFETDHLGGARFAGHLHARYGGFFAVPRGPFTTSHKPRRTFAKVSAPIGIRFKGTGWCS